MKNYILLLLFMPLLSFSQKIDDHWIKFDYERLPLKPLDRQIQSYQSKVISWEDEKSSEIQQRYEQELAIYHQNYKIAQAQYQKELKEYNRKTQLEKVVDKTLLEENKPVFNPPPYPEFTELPKSPDNENLASKYLSLNGYKKGIYNPVFITVQLKEFERGETTSKTKTTGEGDKQKKTITYYTKYQQPIKLTIESTVNGVLFDDVLKNSLKEYTYKSNKRPTNEEVKKYAVNDLMTYTSNFINSQYGKSRRTTSFSIVTIKKFKKHSYYEYEDALSSALSGYKNIYLDKNKSISSFNKAINIWEKTLEEYKPNDKKARVNREVAWYTMLNIAEAYLWIENFEKADEYFSRMQAIQDTKGNKRRLDFSKNLLQDQRERFLANQPD